MSEDRCICCGEIVPEGRMVCPNCEKPKKPRKCNYPEESPYCAFHYSGICTRDHNYECPALAMKNLSHGEMVQIAEGKKNKTPRYIDANKLIDLATHEGAYGYVDVHDIYNVPTADVVKVVRCKDCIFSKNPPYRGTAKVNDHIKFCCQGEEPFLTHDEWFCASGMRNNVMEGKTDAEKIH